MSTKVNLSWTALCCIVCADIRTTFYSLGNEANLITKTSIIEINVIVYSLVYYYARSRKLLHDKPFLSMTVARSCIKQNPSPSIYVFCQSTVRKYQGIFDMFVIFDIFKILTLYNFKCSFRSTTYIELFSYCAFFLTLQKNRQLWWLVNN